MDKHELASLSSRIYQRPSWPNYILAVGVIVMSMNLIIAATFDIAEAAQKESTEIEDFVLGEVTDKRENVIRIDSKEYSFFADVIVKDQNLMPKTFKDVVPGTQVMFHLRQGRIDQIIILLPS